MEKQLKLSSVSQTLFIPLYCRAMETLSNNPIIHDGKAIEIVRRLKVYSKKELIKFAEDAGYKEVSVVRMGKVNLLKGSI